MLPGLPTLKTTIRSGDGLDYLIRYEYSFSLLGKFTKLSQILSSNQNAIKLDWDRLTFFRKLNYVSKVIYSL